jgi:hypothetical protein
MIRQRTVLVAGLFMIIGCMTACQPESSIGVCLPASVTWEFPEGLKSDQAFLDEEIPPSGGWKAETSLPVDDTPYDLVVHNDDIWVLMYEKLFRYRTATRTWDEFTTIDGLDAAPRNLYQAGDGTLWAIDFGVFEDLDILRARPFLARYNDANEQFELVRDRDNILHSSMGLISITKSTMMLDEKMWMLVLDGLSDEHIIYRLLSFDPSELQVTEHFTKDAPYRMTKYPQTTYSSIEMGPDGKIWMADVGLEQLASYDPVSGEYAVYDGRTIGILRWMSREALIGYIHSLYVDKGGRLWLDDRGWIDFSNPRDPSWHTIVRSPVFISDSVSPENQYAWSRPQIIYQSSDGMYWFADANVGMVRLNPETGEWCKFTTGFSPIAEDSQGNLWIAVYGKLYRYQLPR